MFALVGVFALIGAACSDNSSTGTTDTGSGSGGGCSADQFGCVEIAAGDPITVGTLLAITGDNKNLGLDSQYGVQLAVDHLDGKFDATAGTLLDHPVTLVNEDDGCSAEGGQQGATTLAANDAIVAVIGTSCSSASLGVADKIFSDKGITIISPSATNPALTTEGTHQPFYFRTAHNDRIQAAVVVDYAVQKLGAKTAVTIHDESPYTQGLTDGFAANFEAQGGTMNSDEAVNSGDNDFKTLLTQIAQNPPDVIYAPDFNPVCALIAKQKADTSGLENTSSWAPTVAPTPATRTSAATRRTASSCRDRTSPPSAAAISTRTSSCPRTWRSSGPTRSRSSTRTPTTPRTSCSRRSRLRRSEHRRSLRSRGRRSATRCSNQRYQGIIGTITCTPLGDCATSVTIGVYEVPNVGFLDPAAKPVFTETKTLDEVA